MMIRHPQDRYQRLRIKEKKKKEIEKKKDPIKKIVREQITVKELEHELQQYQNH
jgi:hypothetical protein